MSEKQDIFIVLKTQEHLEKNKKLTVVSPNFGVYNVLAKGIRDKKAKLRFLGLPFVLADVVVFDRTLRAVKTASLVDSNANISKDIDKFESACFCASIVLLFDGEQAKNLFELFAITIKKINEGSSPWSDAFLFALNLLSIEGYELSCDKCVSCGKDLDVPMLNIDTGELSCKNCASQHCQQVKTSTIAALDNISKDEKFDSEKITDIKNFFNQVFLSIFGKGLVK